MKKLLIISITVLLISSIQSQEVKKDSIFHKDRFYYSTDPDYEKIKIEFENLNFEAWFMPGLGYTFYYPKESDSTGLFHGIAVNYLIYAKMYQNNKPGPSHVRFYSKFSIVKSDRSGINDLFCYSLGLSFSFEKNPKRAHLVPFFGLEFGGLSQSQWGTTGQFTPTLGLHIISKRNLFINIQGGYVYPITNFDILQGLFLEAGVNFALW
ncbi:MAG: hypothetical protein K8R68_04570 [Bacteroidales bacterium]|nr:hypothetical protein [Bacteroidales bacterium]